MLFGTILGWTTAISSVIVFLPQLWLSFSKNSTKGLSFTFLCVESISAFLWVVYSIYLNQLPIIISNFLYFLTSSSLLILKITHKIQKKVLINQET